MTRHLSGHVVVIGDTRVARAILRQEAARGEAVHVGREPAPMLDATPDPTEIPIGVDPAATLAASDAGASRVVVVDLADDPATVATIAALVDGTASGGSPALVANLRDRALRRVVDDNLFAAGLTPRPRIVGTAALAAGAAIGEARAYDLAYWRGQDRVHAAILGFSALGRGCFEELALSGIAGDLGKPRIAILDPDPASVRKLLDRDMPEIGASVDLSIATYDPLTFTAPDGALAAADAVAPLTLIVIALDDPGEAMSAMTSLARMQEGDGQAVASVLVVSETAQASLELARPRGRPGDLARSWSVRGGIDGDHDILDLVTRRVDLLAEQIHDSYRQRFGGFGLAGSSWEGLPETYRAANRRAAAHLPAKLWTLGLREPGASGDPFAVDPHIHENVIKPCAASTSEDALLRRLSRIEHERWCAERRLDGWRFGDVRDDARRIHPKLIAFDDPRFTDLDIEKDAEQVRFLFGTVVRPSPDGAVTPLVIGVEASGQGPSGIPLEAALALCVKEEWRPIIVLSGLLDGSECRLVTALAEAFASAGRSWRLLVPEVTRDNREIRALEDDSDRERREALVARPTTRFAPIGRGVVAAADLWADPSAPDPHVGAILAYIAARASAIVDRSGPA